MLPVIMTLTFGAIEFGLAFRDSAAVSASTRSGARMSAAMPAVGCSTLPCTTYDGFWDAARTSVNDTLKDLTGAAPQELVIFKADPSTGKPIGGATYDACNSCYRYAWDSASKSFPSTTQNTSPSYWTADQQKTDLCAGNVDAIGVYVRVHQNFLTGVFHGGPTYDHVTVMQLEPIDPALCS